MTNGDQRSDFQRQHEKFWWQHWATPFANSLDAVHCSANPGADPPDVEFSLELRDQSRLESWGELTGTYAGSIEAAYLWDETPPYSGLLYSEPDESIVEHTVTTVAKKLLKYQDLVQSRGHGHLLVLLNSPLTTRTVRRKAEKKILPLLVQADQGQSNPFASVWLAYRLGQTSYEEMEKPQYAFPVSGERDRFNFFKRIWVNGNLLFGGIQTTN